MPDRGGLFLRGPWHPDQVRCRWIEDAFVPPAEAEVAADAAIAALRKRGSPSHDGLSARLAGASVEGDELVVELQPARWALRLVEGYRSGALSALCVVRDRSGRWLAGRRASWVASWAGRWALGAGGAVDLGESPAETLARELREEWSVEAESLQVEALVERPDGLTFVIGTALLPEDAEPSPDAEHDAWAWWPPEVERWPDEADAPLRTVGALLSA